MEISAEASIPYRLLRPVAQSAPVILTSPHSGRAYEAGFLAMSRLDATAIRRSEDSFVNDLFDTAPALGIPLLAANFPRAYCDVNREAWELDPAMFTDELPDYVNTSSPRVLAGLGTIARLVGNNEPIYHGKMPFSEAQKRISACWEPFHAALRSLIDDTVSRFGVCLVIDCHSMPSAGGYRGGRPDVVLGDGFGTCCEPAITQFIHRTFGQMGLDVRRNDPYAGGYITRHYGRPRHYVQAVQVELLRGLYMDEARFTKTQDFAVFKGKMTRFLQQLVREAAMVPGIAAMPPVLAAE